MNIIGIFVSIVFLFGIIYLSTYISKVGNELSRKFVHIGVCHWWIIAMIFFDHVIYASIVPIIFIIINIVSYKINLFPSMERKDNSLGTIYMVISCLILVILSFFWFDSMIYGCIGMLVMGYGDGFASLFGHRFSSKKIFIFGSEKSIVGSITMFVFSFITISIISLIFGMFSIVPVLIISITATLVEMFSVFGIDNLSVPLVTAILSYFIL